MFFFPDVVKCIYIIYHNAKTHCVTNLRASTQRCAALRAGAATVRSWQMVQWLPGAIPSGGDRKSRASFKMYSGSRLHPLHLLRSGKMGHLLLGDTQLMAVVTALQSKTGSARCFLSMPVDMPSLHSWQMDQWLPGAMNALEVTALKSKIGLETSRGFSLQVLPLLRFSQMDP